jgi:hypothetical protein
MKLTIEERAFPLPDAVLKAVAINCWTDDVPPDRFMIVVTEAYAESYQWDLSQGLRDAVELQYGKLLALAQEAADRGEIGLYLA